MRFKLFLILSILGQTAIAAQDSGTCTTSITCTGANGNTATAQCTSAGGYYPGDTVPGGFDSQCGTSPDNRMKYCESQGTQKKKDKSYTSICCDANGDARVYAGLGNSVSANYCVGTK